LEPEDVAERVDAGTQLVAFSGVQTATTARARALIAAAIVFVDGSQMVAAGASAGECC